MRIHHWIAACLPLLLLTTLGALAHNISDQDQTFVERNAGVHFSAFVYLGAKHMVTGYDHLLYLTGVIFFLNRLRDIAIFVSLFAIGHSITLLTGVLLSWQVNASIVDAIIGFSLSTKHSKTWRLQDYFSRWLDVRLAVLLFG